MNEVFQNTGVNVPLKRVEDSFRLSEKRRHAVSLSAVKEQKSFWIVFKFVYCTVLYNSAVDWALKTNYLSSIYLPFYTNLKQATYTMI